MKYIYSFFLVIISLNCFSQEIHKINFDSAPIEGIWVAVSGDKSYEIEFIKETIYLDRIDITVEAVTGSIIYRKNSAIIKAVPRSKMKSPLVLFSISPSKYEILYTEKDNNKNRREGKVNFDLSADGKTAHWHNLYWRSISEIMDDFDIPKELTFKKKE